MRRKNLWLRLSSCTMAALIATTSIVPVSAAEVDFQDEASADVAEEAAEEVPAEKPKRGRPREVKEQEPEVTPKKEAAEVPAEKPKRGRPRKKPVEAAAPEK